MTEGTTVPFTRDVVIVGGCGRVGLPLGLSLADAGLSVALFDIDAGAVAVVAEGRLPFDEPGAQVVLDKVLQERRLEATTDGSAVGAAEHVIVVIGTDVDEYLNPDPGAMLKLIETLAPSFTDGQLLVLRSTVFPGVTRLVDERIAALGKQIDVAFCPERIAEGRAMIELRELPEIISGCTPRAAERADALFRHLTPDTQLLSPEEAELAKLFSNTWRYIKFATANQLYMIANDFGLDYERIRSAMAYRYPRAADLPSAGFAAGPCLFKDTMQLAAFNNNNFVLGHSAMMINEGMPLYVIAKIGERFPLKDMTVGILGMAFKAESDDRRSSLSYKMKRILKIRAAQVLCTDPYVATDPALVPLEEVLERSDLLIVGAPHRAYETLKPEVPVIDIWNLLGDGVRV
jgi:UDP-N-acetyl-D-mannosaminuronic acid dehydrogenase